MTQDEIIELAIQAGLLVKRGLLGRCSESNFEAFAKLVSAKEREACANTVEKIETYEKIEKACFKFAAKTIRSRG